MMIAAGNDHSQTDKAVSRKNLASAITLDMPCHIRAALLVARLVMRAVKSAILPTFASPQIDKTPAMAVRAPMLSMSHQNTVVKTRQIICSPHTKSRSRIIPCRPLVGRLRDLVCPLAWISTRPLSSLDLHLSARVIGSSPRPPLASRLYINITLILVTYRIHHLSPRILSDLSSSNSCCHDYHLPSE